MTQTGKKTKQLRTVSSNFRIMKIRNYFTEHPASVGESYRQHLRVATRYSAQLFLAAGACAVHAVIPKLFTTTASTKIKDLHSQMVESGRTKLKM